MALFRRHLGLPACAELDERMSQLATDARVWYAASGEPWTAACHVSIREIDDAFVWLDQGFRLTSSFLASGLQQAGAEALVVVAVSAGASVDERIAKLWESDRPDEAMFLHAYAIAVVEHLRWQFGDHLPEVLRARNLTVLPHYSPGYEGWDLADQMQLFRLVAGLGATSWGPLEISSSGELRPSKSTLAAFGITARTDVADDISQYWNCRSVPTSMRHATPRYAFPAKALARWSTQRLQLTNQANDEILATFRFDGSTCSNMGIPLALEYRVCLTRDLPKGYRILSSTCQPHPDDTGLRSMCAYLDNPPRFMSQLMSYRPLIGRPLRDALTWRTPTSPAGCVCTRAGQDHKWQIVLQTIHYALEDHE